MADDQHGLDLKKNRPQVLDTAQQRAEQEKLNYSLATLCDWYGISRQAHYQMKEWQRERAADAQRVLDQVKALRQRHKRLGTRKLHHVLAADVNAKGFPFGRDRLFDLLRENNLLVPPCRRQQRTTWAGTGSVTIC